MLYVSTQFSTVIWNKFRGQLHMYEGHFMMLKCVPC